MAEEPRGPGRPRSEHADRAILEATIDGLAEDGFEGLTMEAVAARAGVSKATLYRRWSSREVLVRGAVEAFVRGIAIPNSGSVETDLVVLMGDSVQAYRGRRGRLMPGLVSAMARHPELGRVVREEFLRARRAAFRAVLRRGIERGELRPDVDVELALDFLGGPLFYRLLVTGGPLDEAFARGVVDVMLRGTATNPVLPSSLSTPVA